MRQNSDNDCCMTHKHDRRRPTSLTRVGKTQDMLQQKKLKTATKLSVIMATLVPLKI